MTNNNAFKLANPIHFFALGFGSGLLKPAPGTWGTLAAIPVYLGLLTAFSGLGQMAGLAYGVSVFLAFLVGIYLCGKTAEDVGVHDHSAIVWDEVVGFLITMALVVPSWQNILIGFLLFRVFDILKPWPIKALDQHVHGGFGIMIDDVLAAVFAGLILYFCQPYLAFGA